MPDYTPVEEDWLRVFEVSEARPSRRDPFRFASCIQVLADGRASDTDRFGRVYEPHPTKYSLTTSKDSGMEITKALAALQPLYGKGNIEIVTEDGHRVRGIVRSMKTTQALTTPSVKVERADGEIVKVPFSSIIEIINHNPPA
jgi:hypothetical protein